MPLFGGTEKNFKTGKLEDTQQRALGHNQTQAVALSLTSPTQPGELNWCFFKINSVLIADIKTGGRAGGGAM